MVRYVHTWGFKCRVGGSWVCDVRRRCLPCLVGRLLCLGLSLVLPCLGSSSVLPCLGLNLVPPCRYVRCIPRIDAHWTVDFT